MKLLRAIAKAPHTTWLIIVIAVLMLTLQGCASLAKGTTQTVSIRLHDEVPNDQTTCTVSNSSGTQDLRPPKSTVARVDRSHSVLTIECENSTQTGSQILHSDFKSEYLVQDLILDLCIISCIVDAITEAWYSYPSISDIFMEPEYEEKFYDH